MNIPQGGILINKLSSFKQLLQFNAVGLINTLLDIGIYILLTYAGVSYLIAQFISYACGTANSYAMNRRWTFGETDRPSRTRRTLVRFLALNACSLGLSSILLYVFLHHWGWSHFFSKAAATCVTMCFLFCGSKFWVFAPEKHGREEGFTEFQ